MTLDTYTRYAHLLVADRRYPVPKASVTTTVTEEVTIKPSIAAKLRTDLGIYKSLKHQAKAIDRQLDVSRENVLQLGISADVGEKFELDGFKVALVLDSTKKALDKVKLLKLMVAAGLSVKKATEVIEKATTETPVKAHARISVPGAEDAEIRG